jgi:opacity protein-like surface antigen
MKKMFIAVAALFIAFGASAQTPVPDFKNSPMLLNGGKLVRLEKQSAEIKNKTNGFGYGGNSTNFHLDGPHSDVRTATNKPEFVIKVDEGVDPETLFYLTVCLRSRKGRDVELQKSSAFAAYGATGKSAKRFHVKLNYEKIADNVFKITLDEPLEDAEEYAFISVGQGSLNGTNSLGYAFGVGALGK